MALSNFILLYSSIILVLNRLSFIPKLAKILLLYSVLGAWSFYSLKVQGIPFWFLLSAYAIYDLGIAFSDQVKYTAVVSRLIMLSSLVFYQSADEIHFKYLSIFLVEFIFLASLNLDTKLRASNLLLNFIGLIGHLFIYFLAVKSSVYFIQYWIELLFVFIILLKLFSVYKTENMQFPDFAVHAIFIYLVFDIAGLIFNNLAHREITEKLIKYVFFVCAILAGQKVISYLNSFMREDLKKMCFFLLICGFCYFLGPSL